MHLGRHPVGGWLRPSLKCLLNCTPVPDQRGRRRGQHAPPPRLLKGNDHSFRVARYLYQINSCYFSGQRVPLPGAGQERRHPRDREPERHLHLQLSGEDAFSQPLEMGGAGFIISQIPVDFHLILSLLH